MPISSAYILVCHFIQESHEKCLRPGLGHPSQREQLENLCSKEEERHKASIKTTNQHTSAAKVMQNKVI
ncbi:MAG: DUF4456 domain-containing protein [Proteobacteria bacterium]|nr:DUF4456 domain-containing protein [Pseudomonadota bacterium]